MPGHTVTPSERDHVMADVQRIDSLIRDHDIVYLLTDTRESRWLPTMLAVASGTPCITTALGFDSFLVMRHGLFPRGATNNVPGKQKNNLLPRTGFGGPLLL